jgi:dihydroflavonol-4-reductase
VRGPALVTGGSGFVGGALVRRLVAEGIEVRALARSGEAAARVESLGARVVRGDVLDPPSITSAAAGCSIVFHAAGVNAMCGSTASTMLRVNVEGSRNVVFASAAAGVERLVYTSSAAAIGERHGTVGREDSPHRGSFLSSYERSKFLAERVVFEGAREAGLEVVALNPASVQGPGRTTGTARLLVAAATSRLAPIVNTTVSLVDVDDCTEGHVRAGERGTPGERYVLCGAVLTARALMEALQRVAGRRPKTVVLPRALVSLAGALAGPVGRLLHRDVPLCPELARTLLHGHAYDGSRSERELGLRYTPVEETLRRTIAWHRDRGGLANRGPGASA